jgi:cyanophycinase
MSGLLSLNGGDEFRPGNEPQDRELIAAAGPGPAYVVPTAAKRQHPELAVSTARQWFSGLDLEIEELPIYTRSDANSPALAARARAAGLLYLTGGDPGLLVQILRESAVWRAMAEAWKDGAALAGSSAGAMALCQCSLVMARWPRHEQRRPVPALDLVPETAVLPHYERMGSRWSVDDTPGRLILLGLDERTAAVWSGAAWRAVGEGAVTVLRDGQVRRFGTGEPCDGLPAPRWRGAGG